MEALVAPLAYIGPETIIPATSILAALCGILLTFGKWIMQPFVAACHSLAGKKKPVQAENKPV